MTDPSPRHTEDDLLNMEGYDVCFDGDGLTLRCRRCGHELHFSPAHHISAVREAATIHRVQAHPVDAPHP